MDELEGTLRAVTTAIGDGRIGTPMAARIVVQAGDRAAAQAAKDRALAAVEQWFGSKPGHLDSHGASAQTETTLARFPAGQSALVTVAANCDSTAPLGVVAFGTKGIISLDPACAGVHGEDAGTRRHGDAEKASVISASPRPSVPAAPRPSVPASPPFGVLLVTGGFSHQEDYAKAFAADRRCKLIGLTDEPDITPRRKQYNEQLAKTLGIPVLPSLNEALARSDVHIVSVCAEPERRGPIIVRAAEAGKHLYLDKPLAASLAQADSIVAAVDKARVVSQMFSMVHWPNSARIRRLVDSGSLGKLIGVHVDLTFAKGPAGTADLQHPRQEIAAPTGRSLEAAFPAHLDHRGSCRPAPGPSGNCLLLVQSRAAQ